MTQPWKNSLFSCFSDIPTCVIGYFAPCYLFGQNAEQIDGSSKIKMCVLYQLAGCCCLSCLLHKPRREKLRAAYNLEEKPKDLLVSCCCGCCAHIQESKEMRDRGVTPGGRIPVVAQPGR